jgi:hypothetical protein
MPEGVRVVQYFGLSDDEPRRVSKVKNRFIGHRWAEGRFPLFDLEVTRGDCVAYLEEQDIPHKVPRSACVFCPFRSNHEWRLLRDNDSAGWARALEMDEALRRPGTVANRNLEQSIYLHRSCLSLVEVDLDERDLSGGVVGGECEGMCRLSCKPPDRGGFRRNQARQCVPTPLRPVNPVGPTHLLCQNFPRRA